MEGVLQVGESIRPHLASAGRQVLIHFGSISGIQFWGNLGQFYDLQLTQFFFFIF